MNPSLARRVFAPLALALLAALTFLPGTARAQTWHHVHLTATDSKAAADWYAKFMGGTYERIIDKFDAAVFGKTKVLFYQKEKGFLPSDGSSIDHIGFSFANLDAKMEEFKAAGIKVLMEPRKLGKIKFGFIEDANGVKIEVMEDADLLGFHHVHLHTPNPEATLGWYKERFGGEVGKYGGALPAMRLPEFWLIAQKFAKPKAGTDGRAVDHLAWKIEGLDAYAADLKTKGVQFLEDVHEFGLSRKAVIVGPDGVKIELIQPAPAAP